jgi:hypothetical protein
MIMKRMPEDAGHPVEADVARHIRDIHASALRPFLRIRDVGDFSLKLAGLLVYIEGKSTARLHPLFTPFCEAFIEALELIAGSLLGEKRFEDRVGYFTFLMRYLMTRSAPFEGTPLRGLQALGLLETRNIRFDRVFVLDANEDVLPVTRREDSLIPGRARELLGLSTYRDRDKLAAYYFDCLIKGARQADIFFVENNQKEKSRFVEKIVWELQRRRGAVKGAGEVRTLQYQVNLVNSEPAAVGKDPGTADRLRRMTYSASAVDTHLACPLKFYYRYALRLSEKEDSGEGLERRDIGTIAHDALAAYFRPRLGRPLSAGDIDRVEIAERVRRVFEDSYGGPPAGSAYLIMKRIQERLADYLSYYVAPQLPDGLVMLDVEADMTARFHDFALKGRIDAAQERAGRTHILDYKTSANKGSYRISFDRLEPGDRATWSAVGSMQLPVYRILYASNRGMERGDLNAMFLMLGMTRMNSEIELPLFREEGGDDAESALIDDVLKRLLTEICDPGTPFHPTSDKKRNCPHCDFTAICGTQWAVR